MNHNSVDSTSRRTWDLMNYETLLARSYCGCTLHINCNHCMSTKQSGGHRQPNNQKASKPNSPWRNMKHLLQTGFTGWLKTHHRIPKSAICKLLLPSQSSYSFPNRQKSKTISTYLFWMGKYWMWMKQLFLMCLIFLYGDVPSLDAVMPFSITCDTVCASHQRDLPHKRNWILNSIYI